MVGTLWYFQVSMASRIFGTLVVDVHVPAMLRSVEISHHAFTVRGPRRSFWSRRRGQALVIVVLVVRTGNKVTTPVATLATYCNLCHPTVLIY